MQLRRGKIFRRALRSHQRDVVKSWGCDRKTITHIPYGERPDYKTPTYETVHDYIERFCDRKLK